MGFLANAAARSEMKVRDSALELLREIRPEFALGNVTLPCHLAEEVHNGFFVDTGAITVGIFRCERHWWAHQLENDALVGLTSPDISSWLSHVKMMSPQDIGILRGGVPELISGLAYGLPTLAESSLRDMREGEVADGSPSSVFEFTAQDLLLQLKGDLSHTEFEAIPFPAAADGIALRILNDGDTLLYYRNFGGGWGERNSEGALGGVDGDALENITLPRLSIQVAWDVVRGQFSARQRQKDTSTPPNLATVEAVAFLREAADSKDSSVSELALSCLAHLQFWTPDELKAALGFKGPSQEVFALVRAFVSEVEAQQLFESVISRAEDDGSYTMFIEYRAKSAVSYRLSAEGEWSEGSDPPPLTTTVGTELSSPTTSEVVTQVAATIAWVLNAEYDEAERNAQPIEVNDRWVRVVAFLKLVAAGDVEGYELASAIADDYLDYARRWTSDTARAALGIRDPEILDLSFIDFSGFDLPEEDEPPKSK